MQQMCHRVCVRLYPVVMVQGLRMEYIESSSRHRSNAAELQRFNTCVCVCVDCMQCP